jgi:hypothetical protein
VEAAALLEGTGSLAVLNCVDAPAIVMMSTSFSHYLIPPNLTSSSCFGSRKERKKEEIKFKGLNI